MSSQECDKCYEAASDLFCIDCLDDKTQATIDALRVRAEAAEKALVEEWAKVAALEASAAALREALLICDHEQRAIPPEQREKIRQALVSGAGAAFLAEREAMFKVVGATEAECAKFNFPDEDRPELHEALAAWRALTKEAEK